MRRQGFQPRRDLFPCSFFAFLQSFWHIDEFSWAQAVVLPYRLSIVSFGVLQKRTSIHLRERKHRGKGRWNEKKIILDVSGFVFMSIILTRGSMRLLNWFLQAKLLISWYAELFCFLFILEYFSPVILCSGAGNHHRWDGTYQHEKRQSGSRFRTKVQTGGDVRCFSINTSLVLLVALRHLVYLVVFCTGTSIWGSFMWVRPQWVAMKV